MKGFFSLNLHTPETGGAFEPTVDIFTSVGDVWILHEDLVVVRKAVQALHDMETNGSLLIRPSRRFTSYFSRALVGLSFHPSVVHVYNDPEIFSGIGSFFSKPVGRSWRVP
jgi:hypothetical protein